MYITQIIVNRMVSWTAAFQYLTQNFFLEIWQKEAIHGIRIFMSRAVENLACKYYKLVKVLAALKQLGRGVFWMFGACCIRGQPTILSVRSYSRPHPSPYGKGSKSELLTFLSWKSYFGAPSFPVMNEKLRVLAQTSPCWHKSWWVPNSSC